MPAHRRPQYDQSLFLHHPHRARGAGLGACAQFQRFARLAPAATDSHIEAGHGAGAVGCVRNFALTDGSGRIRETLLSISDPDRCLSYDMLPGGPLPFVDYISTMRFSEITDRGETFAQWWADFKADDGRDDHWHKFVEQEVFLGGFRALEASFSS